MSARTFLQLCKATVAELGVQGGNGPADTQNQFGELLNIINWVADADLYVQNLWLDWSFLWTEDSRAATVGSNEIASTTGKTMREIDADSVVIALSSPCHPSFERNFTAFRRAFLDRPLRTSDRPAYWTRKPTGGPMLFSTKFATAVTVKWSGYLVPKRMVANDDLSPIPDSFDRIIICKAKMTYAEREDAPEIMAGSAAEYEDLLEKLEAAHLHRNQHNRQIINRDPVQAYVV